MKTSYRKIIFSIILFILIGGVSILPTLLKADEVAPAIPEDNLLYPVIIALDSGGTGSGFYLNTKKATYLVTAKHVLYKKEGEKESLSGKTAVLQSYDRDSNIQVLRINLEKLVQNNTILCHPTEDLVIIKVLGADVKDQGRVKFLEGVITDGNVKITGVPLEGIKRLQDVHVGNDVYIFGYPTSLQNPALGIDFTKPLLKKGLIAGKDLKSKKIILDASLYFGTSGGLVLQFGYNTEHPLAREYRAVGIVLMTVPFINEFKSKQYGYSNLEFENSGYSLALPMDFLLDLIKDVEK